jgi:hypothetical protein
MHILCKEVMLMERWIHGHSVQVESPKLFEVKRVGHGVQVQALDGIGPGYPNEESWFHFAIPSPIYNAAEEPLEVYEVMIRLRHPGDQPKHTVFAVLVWDGDRLIMRRDYSQELCYAEWTVQRVGMDVWADPVLQWGLGISVGVHAEFWRGTKMSGVDEGFLEFSSVGASFGHFAPSAGLPPPQVE